MVVGLNYGSQEGGGFAQGPMFESEPEYRDLSFVIAMYGQSPKKNKGAKASVITEPACKTNMYAVAALDPGGSCTNLPAFFIRPQNTPEAMRPQKGPEPTLIRGLTWN